MIRFLWRATRGNRFTPWKSPYLRWRMETYWGVPAENVDFLAFWRFSWEHRGEFLRFLRWAGRMDRQFRTR